MLGRLVLIAALAGGGFVAGMAYTGTGRQADRVPAGTVAGPPEATVPVATPAGAPIGALPDFSDIAARAVETVTNISSYQERRRRAPFADDPLFRYFFGDMDDMFGWRSRRETSLGSGVIVSPDGYVLTNNHVVGANTTEITVALADRRELPARIVGLDEWTDLALLKIDATGLQPLPWADSSQLRVAEWVLAIGNPFQLSQTVTLGIVSAVGRTLEGRVAMYEDFIQTDAAINPGNSGGALVTGRGELVGINTAIFSQTGGYQGIGFAVPSNLARRIMEDLIRYGQVRRGSIGFVEIVPLTTELARQTGAPSTRGAAVWRMRRDSEAFRAGIRPGDVIVSFNGVQVDDPSHFLRLVADAEIGSTGRVGLVREGRKLEVDVRIGETGGRRLL